MKSIDWKEVSSNHHALSKQFSLDVYDKFSILSYVDIDSNNMETVYENLVKSTQEIALSTLPKKKGRGNNKINNGDKVLKARSILKTKSQNYHKTPTQNNKIQLIAAEKDLDNAYLDAEVNFIQGKIDNLSMEHISKKHHLA